MAPTRGTKRKSDANVSAADHGSHDVQDAADQRIDTKAGSTPDQESPRKKQNTGIPLAQKQALIENLQLEITDRARKLRAQYNLQAQGLRTRIEIRVNRIPMALRRAKMGDLADKYKNGQHPQQTRPTPSSMSHSARPPPVPEKDMPSTRPPSSLSVASQATKSSRGPGRPPKRASDGNSTTTNEPPQEPVISKTKVRSNPNIKQEAGLATNSRALSPSSANIRPAPRATPNAKALTAQPLPAPADGPGRSKSPVKQMSATNLFSNWAEKARSTRTGATGKRGNPPAPSTSSATTAAKGKKPATSTTTKMATATKTQRRASGTSESSESSTSTGGKKSTTKGSAASTEKAAPAASKRIGVMGSIRRGVTGTTTTKKAAVDKVATASTATGRVLRKRNN